MNETAISWTDVTWNPVHGCHKVSEGCRFCYAERISLKFGHTKKPWTKANASENVLLKPAKLRDPYNLKKPSRVFVNSMSDLFHEAIPDDYRARIFAVMLDNPQHTFQVLTKRPENAAAWDQAWQDTLTALAHEGNEKAAQTLERWPSPWAPNIWMGTSVENEKAVPRIEALRQCGAKVRFVSAEPLIGPLGTVDLAGIHWLIVGGESGDAFRPMDMHWARHLRDQCVDQGVAFFYKQDCGKVTELRPWLVEHDGSKWQWHQYPGQLTDPTPLDDRGQPLTGDDTPMQLVMF